MLTLKNGDKWIIDDREIDDAVKAGIPYSEIKKGNLPATSIESFLNDLLDAEKKYYCPRKLIADYGGHWDCNFSAYYSVLREICVRKCENEFGCAYELENGNVWVIYEEGGDSGGSRVKIFENVIAYNEAANLK